MRREEFYGSMVCIDGLRKRVVFIRLDSLQRWLEKRGLLWLDSLQRWLEERESIVMVG